MKTCKSRPLELHTKASFASTVNGHNYSTYVKGMLENYRQKQNPNLFSLIPEHSHYALGANSCSYFVSSTFAKQFFLLWSSPVEQQVQEKQTLLKRKCLQRQTGYKVALKGGRQQEDIAWLQTVCSCNK